MENVHSFMATNWNVAKFMPIYRLPVTMVLEEEISLSLMQAKVEGFICPLFDGVVFGKKLQMWVNDEGGINGMAHNAHADAFLDALGLGRLRLSCCRNGVHGPLLVLRGVAMAT